jgi:flagellar biosynthesis protein FlhB
MGLSYLLNINHFVPDGTADDLIKQAINMSMHLMPWCIISFGVFIGFTFYVEYSAKKTTEILLQVIKTEGKVTKEELKENNIAKYIAQGAILIIAVVFIVIGVANGGAADVLQKAVNICRECIGIG